ncbi:hypothetical protein ABEB36_007635 [Hypothenemus hampei]|uniref:Gamma-tubulin complex component n=1 Tax=Hypothenemus hampei TaxID=57062 RepID=A0ABD1EUR8_HYPHA
MSIRLSAEIVDPLKDLITEISNFEEASEPFKFVLRHFVIKLSECNTMYFPNKREIDENINGMSEKYCFHGFTTQANALKTAYKTYIPDLLLETETMNRLNVIKFLLCMSNSPTNHFLNHPDLVIEQPMENEDEIDWAEYLNEGMDKYRPLYEDSSDEDCSFGDQLNTNVDISDSRICPLTQIKSMENICVMDLRSNREELLITIQHSWYNEESFCMEPESEEREANIGILWENYLKEQVQGLIPLSYPSIISEYKVIREILWQLFYPHTSSTIEIVGNSIRPRPDVTLASVRTYAFYTFMNEFVSYIELLNFFRDFKDLMINDLEQDNFTICRTYQNYCNSISDLLDPVYNKLSQLELEVRQQEKTYTLINLAENLKDIFKPVQILKQIHDEIIVNPANASPVTCASTLIGKLHESLNFTCNKLEQDIKLTLFMQTCYHYINLVDFWLMKDDLPDYIGEFVIERKTRSDRLQAQFVVRSLDETSQSNSFLDIFRKKLSKIGFNIHFLRLLGKYDLIGNCQIPIYDEFIRDSFQKIHEINNTKPEEQLYEEIDQNKESLAIKDSLIFPVISIANIEIQKLENLVDVEDGFLMAAFADFFVKKPKESHRKKTFSFFERVSQSTTFLFPKTHLFEDVLINILDRRFTVSGLIVKNLLSTEHLLEKQFQFLRHLYMFFDDIIFPFYRRIFEKTESSNKSWANDIWLTSHLHDIFMDIYPEFYEKCSVQVKDGWVSCTDALSACNLINVNYEIPWPLNNIIKQEQMNYYKEIFKFLLQLKWALHTINHLVFADLGINKKTTRKNLITSKLIRLKFCLINILNSLQHFLFGFAFSKSLTKFELDFEKAYDLNTLIESHDCFIQSVFKTVSELKTKMLDKEKNSNVLLCVKLLKDIWNDRNYVNSERINSCNVMYEKLLNNISPILFPVHIYHC